MARPQGRQRWEGEQAEAWAAFVRRRMEELGLSVGDVAEQMDVSYNAVSAWLNGRRRPSPVSNMRMASVLYVPEQQLLELSGHTAPAVSDPERDQARKLIDQIPDSDMPEVTSYLTWRMIESQRRRTHG